MILKIYDYYKYNYISKYAQYMGIDGMHSAIYEHKINGTFLVLYVVNILGPMYLMHGKDDYFELCSDNYIIFINCLNNDSLIACYI